jgi:hypothetical protein
MVPGRRSVDLLGNSMLLTHGMWENFKNVEDIKSLAGVLTYAETWKLLSKSIVSDMKGSQLLETAVACLITSNPPRRGPIMDRHVGVADQSLQYPSSRAFHDE